MRRMLLVLLVAALIIVSLSAFSGAAWAAQGSGNCGEPPPVGVGNPKCYTFGECISFLATTEQTLPIGAGKFTSSPSEFAKALDPLSANKPSGVGCYKGTLPPPT
jgi:hypothetical protein